MRVEDVIDILEQIAPTRFAEPWDNAGLIAGDAMQDVSRALLAIDYTEEVARERAALGCELVIAYHPPIFAAIKRLTAGHLVFEAIRDRVAIYSPHTALDVAEGGTNDVLCDVLEVDHRSPLKFIEGRATQYKLVTFVPEEALDRVSRALFDAGAGRIGDYTSCSFRNKGSGTFFGGAGTRPAVGRSGKLETADEIRIETLVPIDTMTGIIDALRRSHPYEEPAFDLVQLAAPPEPRGLGRIGEFDSPVDRQELFERIKAGLGLKHLLIAGPASGTVQKIAVCAGACGELLDEALSQGAGLYLTGEMRHHDAIRAAAAGLTVVCTLHSNSERAALKRLKQLLEQRLPGLTVHLSQADRDPFSIQ